VAPRWRQPPRRGVPVSGDPLDLDAITDEAERAQRFLRGVRLNPATTLALVAEVRRLREAVEEQSAIIAAQASALLAEDDTHLGYFP